MNTSSQYVLQCHELSHIYPDKTQALNAINLNLEKGKMHVIVGPNGAGKTTFLKIATTQVLPTRGDFHVLGYDVRKSREAITRRIGVMPQQALLYKQLTAWEHTYLFTRLKGLGKNESRQEAERVLTLLDLYDRRNDELNSFSGGMLNAINLAQAIAGDPELLFLDEPTVGLDPKRRKVVWDYLRKLRGEKTILLTTQYLDEAHELADNIITFNKGRVIHEGDVNSTIKKLGYELKVELPLNDENLKIVQNIEAHYYSEQEDKIVIWVKDEKKTVQYLVEANVELSTLSLSRPMLEEAYLNIIGEYSVEEKEL